MSVEHLIRPVTTAVRRVVPSNLLKLIPKDSSFAIVTAFVALFGWAFINIADETMEGETLGLDNAVLMALRQPGNEHLPIGPSWLPACMTDISALGGVSVIMIVLLAVAGFFVLKRKFRMMLYLFLSVGGGACLMFLMKEFFSRPRPSIVPHLQEISHASFPSGHSMVSAIVYLTLAVMLAKNTSDNKVKTYYLLVGMSLTGLVGLSRVYLGVHYPTDVLGGWCAGATWAAATYLIGDWLESRGKVEKEDP